MINLTLDRNDLILIIGTKEAQIYQQSLHIDSMAERLNYLGNEVGRQTQINSELLKDRDMDQLELANLKSKIAQMIMLSEKV